MIQRDFRCTFLVASCHFRFNIQDCYVDKSNGVVVIMKHRVVMD